MATTNTLIFIIEDDMMYRQMLFDHLSQMSHLNIKDFGTGEECLDHIKNTSEKPAIVFLDYYLNSQVKDARDGLEILTELKAISPDTDVVMLSGQDKIQVAVEVMKYGSFDYIVKGESAFYRAEKAVFNIFRFAKMKKDARLYKKLTVTFAIAFVLMIGLFIIMQRKGLITDTPGWF